MFHLRVCVALLSICLLLIEQVAAMPPVSIDQDKTIAQYHVESGSVVSKSLANRHLQPHIHEEIRLSSEQSPKWTSGGI